MFYFVIVKSLNISNLRGWGGGEAWMYTYFVLFIIFCHAVGECVDEILVYIYIYIYILCMKMCWLVMCVFVWM